MYYYGNYCILKGCTIAILVYDNKYFLIIIVHNYVFNKEPKHETHELNQTYIGIWLNIDDTSINGLAI